MLNIIVPYNCKITPVTTRSQHHASHRTSTSNDLVPGTTVDVRWTVAERDFVPMQDHIFVVHLDPDKTLTEIPVLAELNGDGLTESVKCHVVIALP